jgi:hypothetical protein
MFSEVCLMGYLDSRTVICTGVVVAAGLMWLGEMVFGRKGNRNKPKDMGDDTDRKA